MVNRIFSVGDDFTLPAAVKAEDVNLPDRLQDTALNATYGLAAGKGVAYDPATLAYPARPSGAAVQWYGPIPPAGATAGDTWTFRPPATPRPVIFDTDFWTDTDDCVATRLLCHGERLGLIDIRAAIINTQWARSPGALSALFDFEGRPDVPIGTHAYTPPGGPTYQTDVYDKWPHRYGLYSASQTSVSVYRRALAEAVDGTVDIISVGYLTALKDLLASAGDSIDARTGAQLVAAKVRHLWVMGGYWPAGTENNFNRDTTAAAAANNVVSTWPSPVTFLGFEVSASIATGGNLNGTSATDPVALAMLGASHNLGRASWDPMLTWLACLGDTAAAGYTTVKGTATVNATTGVNSWVDSPTGPHRYVVKAQTDRWFRDDLNSRLIPGRDPLPAVPVGMLSGVNITAQQRNSAPRARVALPVRTASQTAGLICNYYGDDFTSLADGNAISHWDDRMLTRPARQTDSTLRPVVAIPGGAYVARFAGLSRLASDTVVLPSSGTVYARVKFDVVPTGSQTVVGADDIDSALRMFSLKVGASGQVIGVGFKGTGGSTATAGNVVAATWHTIAMRYSPTAIQVALDGTWGSSVARTGQNSGSQGICLGNKYTNAQGEAMTGDIRQVRVYDTYHDDATATAVHGVMNS